MIQDFAIIDHLEVEFSSQMTVLTGETGAGKSIIIDALGLLAGGRGSSDFIRKGAAKSLLQGQFSLMQDTKTVELLADLGIECDDGILILQRDLYRNGKNVCRINGVLVNLTTLRQIGKTLIDIHGQNEHQELMHPERHLALVDGYNKEITDKLTVYQRAYHEYRKLQTALEKREKNAHEWAQRLDMLQFQVNEIEEADLRSGEEEELQEQKLQLDNFQTISHALEAGYQALNGEELDVMGVLGNVMDELEEISDLNSDLNEIYEKVSGAYYELQDAAHEISGQLSDLEWDEELLNSIEERLETISRLKRKYGDSIEHILAYYDEIRAELDQMQLSDEDLEQQVEQVAKAKETARKLATELTDLRKQTAKRLENEIHRQLSELYMDKAVFEVRFLPETGELMETGADRVEFYIQTNPGEEMGALAKIASGGELSRIMLALKTIFAQNKGVTSIIFDEVDTGVSGRVAQAIAEKISQIAQHSQVLCITHLPQVAAVADHHYFISKHITAGRTETALKVLSEEERIEELARMLSGSAITALTLEHARELLALAKND